VMCYILYSNITLQILLTSGNNM